MDLNLNFADYIRYLINLPTEKTITESGSESYLLHDRPIVYRNPSRECFTATPLSLLGLKRMLSESVAECRLLG
jgi:hypothetical protein